MGSGRHRLCVGRCRVVLHYLRVTQVTTHDRNRIASNCGAVQSAYDRSDWAWLAGWITGRFGARKVKASWVEANKPKPSKQFGLPEWSDATWAMFWKARLIQSR